MPCLPHARLRLSRPTLPGRYFFPPRCERGAQDRMNRHAECFARTFCLHPSNCIPPNSPVWGIPTEGTFPQEGGKSAGISLRSCPAGTPLVSFPFALRSVRFFWGGRALFHTSIEIFHTSIERMLCSSWNCRVEMFYLFKQNNTRRDIGNTGSGRPICFICPG